jgi:hypothetical protein
MNKLGGAGRAIRGFFAPVEAPPAIEAAPEDAERRELAGRPKSE